MRRNRLPVISNVWYDLFTVHGEGFLFVLLAFGAAANSCKGFFVPSTKGFQKTCQVPFVKIMPHSVWHCQEKQYTMFMDVERSIFAQNLIFYRKKRGFSQGDLAAASGISRRMIGHYEAHNTIPPLEKIELLARALGIKPHQLLENQNDSSSNNIDLAEIDSRSIKKLKDILSLPPEDRNDLYRILNKMLRKNQLEKESKAK